MTDLKKDDTPLVLLVAEDDPDDQLLLRLALEENEMTSELHFVSDGEALLQYLHRHGVYQVEHAAPAPDLILLDLNLPKKNGHEALTEIKRDPNLRHIPVVVFTTSEEAADIEKSYSNGANTYIVKPNRFNTFIEVVGSLSQYWFETASLPPQGAAT